MRARRSITLGTAPYKETPGKESLVFIGVRVLEYADSSLSDMPLDQYVEMALQPDQKLSGKINPLTSNGWNGVHYTVEEATPDPADGNVYSFIGLVWLDKNRILEFFATTLPKDDFSIYALTFEFAFTSLKLSRP